LRRSCIAAPRRRRRAPLSGTDFDSCLMLTRSNCAGTHRNANCARREDRLMSNGKVFDVEFSRSYPSRLRSTSFPPARLAFCRDLKNVADTKSATQLRKTAVRGAQLRDLKISSDGLRRDLYDRLHDIRFSRCAGKLRLNDRRSSLNGELVAGIRLSLGFLGLLHMEIIQSG